MKFRAEFSHKNSKQQSDDINRLLCSFFDLMLGDNYVEMLRKIIDGCGGMSMAPPCFRFGDHEYSVLHSADFENRNWYVNKYWQLFAKYRGEIKEFVKNKERKVNEE